MMPSLPQLDVDSMITLVLLLNVLELEFIVGIVAKLSWYSQLLLNSPELVMVSSVIKQLCSRIKREKNGRSQNQRAKMTFRLINIGG